MERSDVMNAALAGEDTTHQFKESVSNADALAAEMIAMLNADGGTIYIGLVDKVGDVKPLSPLEVARINMLISNAATNNVKPAFSPRLENVAFDDGVVMCLQIPRGIAKPYMTNDGIIWVKAGADKRRVNSKEEILRMFQESGTLHGDEMPVSNTSMADLDVPYFKSAFERMTDMKLEEQNLPMEQLLSNMNLMREGLVTVAGLVLFGNENIRYKYSSAGVKAVCYPGTDIADGAYQDRVDLFGKLADVYQQAVSFCLRHVDRNQGASSFNSSGEPRVPKVVFEELITNALVHRDFMVNDTVKVLIFEDRIEIVSPGHLPNSLTVTNVLSGNSCARNSVVVSYATRLLQFSGLGSGIRRALKAYPHIRFFDDRIGRRFQVIIDLPGDRHG